MTEERNPLSAFFRTVMRELKKRLSAEEFADLLKECEVDPISKMV